MTRLQQLFHGHWLPALPLPPTQRPAVLAPPPRRQSLQDRGVAPLVRSEARILQLNIGLYCNQVGWNCSCCGLRRAAPRGM